MTREEGAIRLTEIWLNHKTATGYHRNATEVVENYNYNLKHMNGNFENKEVNND